MKTLNFPVTGTSTDITQFVDTLDEKIRDLKLIQEKIQNTRTNIVQDEKTSLLCLSIKSKNLYKISIANGLGRLFTIGGGFLTLFGIDQTQKGVGLALTFGAQVFGYTADLYLNKATLQLDENQQLLAIDEKTLTEAIHVEQFAEAFKQVMTMQQRPSTSEGASREIALENVDHRIDQLDQAIKRCLEKYRTLNTAYKAEAAFSHLISTFIQQLPPDDEIKQKLKQLEAQESIKATKSIEDTTLSNELFPADMTKNDRKTSSTGSVRDEDSDWDKIEEAGDFPPFFPTASLTNLQEYPEMVESFKNLVANRWQIQDNIPYIEVGRGRITSEGILDIPPIVEPVQNLPTDPLTHRDNQSQVVADRRWSIMNPFQRRKTIEPELENV